MQTVKLFKRTAALFAAIAVAAVSAAVAAFADGAPLGSGTEADPYIVKSGAELAAIGGSEDGVGYITLANDIDLSAYQGQTCIIKKLTGKLDGAGHKITGLNLKGGKGTWSANILTGLIGELSGNVENLAISDAAITGADLCNYVGTLAAYIPQNSTVNIKNCTVTGEIKNATKSGNYIGAFIGRAAGYAPYNQPENNEPVSLSFDGCISNVKIDCSSSMYHGGLLGYATTLCNVTVSRCAVLGDINASRYACGIVGSYSGTFNITLADSYFGGKLGGINTYGIAYSYSSPTAVTCSNFYYDKTKNGTLDGLVKYKTESDVPGATGVTTAEIMALASTLDGFEASDEFGGYPVPKQQTAAAFSVTVDKSNVNVTAAKAGSYSLVLASYFGDALADVQIQTVTFANDGDGQTVSVPDGFTADGRTFRAMLWSGMCPLAKSNN